MLTLIALFRLGKAALLVAAGLGALRLVRPGVAVHAHRWLATMPFVAHHRRLEAAAREVTTASPHHLEIVASIALAYAALFVVEGVGLWRQRVWAEYLTIAATTSFIPIEIYELARRATAVRAAALAVNVAIVAYLIVRRIRAPR